MAQDKAAGQASLQASVGIDATPERAADPAADGKVHELALPAGMHVHGYALNVRVQDLGYKHKGGD